MSSEYSYLNQSDCLAIDDVDDAQKFQMLMVTQIWDFSKEQKLAW